jgi:hypothetical protein
VRALTAEAEEVRPSAEETLGAPFFFPLLENKKAQV